MNHIFQGCSDLFVSQNQVDTFIFTSFKEQCPKDHMHYHCHSFYYLSLVFPSVSTALRSPWKQAYFSWQRCKDDVRDVSVDDD